MMTTQLADALSREAQGVSTLFDPNAGIIVAGSGGREFVNYGFLCECMDIVRSRIAIRFVSHGNARGADRLFGLWAISRRIAERKLPITQGDWDEHGGGAGPRRNQALLDSFPRPNVVVAMPGGSGTADMVCRANQQGFAVIDVQELIEQVRTRVSWPDKAPRAPSSPL